MFDAAPDSLSEASSMAIDPIICTTADGVATITLNRPDVLNSFDSTMAHALQATLTGFADDDSVRAVVLTGAGRGFCAGQDLPRRRPCRRRRGSPRSRRFRAQHVEPDRPRDSGRSKSR